MKKLLALSLLPLVVLTGGCAWLGKEPVAIPMAPMAYRGWQQAFRLENEAATVVVVPAIGRIMHMGLKDGGNLLRNDASLLGTPPPTNSTWANYGGDWLWPVAQERWSDFAEGNWPPPTALREAPWRGEGWHEVDGSQSCLLTRLYGYPVHAIITRQVTLDPVLARVTIVQSMVSMREAAVPLTFWSITQVDTPQQVFFPARGDSAFTNGFKVMMNTLPKDAITNHDGVIACDLSSGKEFKLGIDATQQWIAARKNDALMVVWADHPFAGNFPDGGCSLELYVAGGDTYAEIETLSPEKILRGGQNISNTLTLDLLALDPAATTRMAAEKIRQFMETGP